MSRAPARGKVGGVKPWRGNTSRILKRRTPAGRRTSGAGGVFDRRDKIDDRVFGGRPAGINRSGKGRRENIGPATPVGRSKIYRMLGRHENRQALPYQHPMYKYNGDSSWTAFPADKAAI